MNAIKTHEKRSPYRNKSNGKKKKKHEATACERRVYENVSSSGSERNAKRRAASLLHYNVFVFYFPTVDFFMDAFGTANRYIISNTIIVFQSNERKLNLFPI